MIVATADHGVAAEGVSTYPREVTAAMVHNILLQTPFGTGGAAVSALARQIGANVYVLDVGVKTTLPAHPQLWRAKGCRSARNLRFEAAMTPTETPNAIFSGADAAARAIREGADLIIPGELGISNTTAPAP